MSLLNRYCTLAAYNRWANERIFRAAAALSSGQYREDRGAFFGSVEGTLNHILVADRIWLQRITGEGEVPQRLDAILYPELASLGRAREQEDARLSRFVAALDEERLAGTIEYTNLSGQRFAQPLAALLDHLFNHQTHHRAQVHTLLTQMGREAPVLDLIAHLRA